MELHFIHTLRDQGSAVQPLEFHRPWNGITPIAPFLSWPKDKEDSDPAKAEQYSNSRARLHEWEAYSALYAANNSGTHQQLSVAVSRNESAAPVTGYFGSITFSPAILAK
jgi:hypothetical protein